MPSTIPISNTNIHCLVGVESAYGVVATVGKLIAYEGNSLIRNQALEKNTELRGNRQMGTKVPGQRNPSGSVMGHQTDLILPQSYYATLGAYDGGTVALGAAPTAALLPATAGLIDDGTHSWKIVVTRPDGTQAYTVSNTLTTATATTGKATITKAGTLPTGWTWAIYRSEAGDAVTGPWVGVPGALTLAAGVTSFIDNIADASLSGVYPAITNNDYAHVFTVGDTLPSYSIGRSHPYNGDAAAYFTALGCCVNKSSTTIKGTGYFDMALDYLFATLDGPDAAAFDVAPLDWRGGEKIHHAMVLAAKVLVDGVAFGKFQDLKIDHMNNLDTTDFPVGGQGDRGSLVPLQAETQVTGSLKVCEPDDLTFVQDSSVTHTLSIQHDFATPGHYIKHELFGIQWDPTDPAPSGQGILKFSANGSASQPTGGEQIIVTIVNGISPSVYTS